MTFEMNAKDKQKERISTYLKPTLKEHGYRTSGNTWWQDKRDFFVVLNLQNSQWNSAENMSFCLNIGPAITGTLRDPQKRRASYSDLTVNLREDAFVSEGRRNRPIHQGWLGYLITTSTDLAEFRNDFATDLEQEILPTLSKLNSLDDWIEFLEMSPFWQEVLTRMISEFRQ